MNLPCGPETLSAFADGDLSPPEAVEVRAHLDSCAACRRELDGIVALKQALAAEAAHPPEPPAAADGWAALAGRLGPTRPAPERRLRWSLIFAPLALGAAAALVWVLRPPAGPSDDRIIAEAEAEFRGADGQYRHALDKLRQVVGPIEARLSPPARQRFAEAQARLERTIEECRDAARARPSDLEAEELLFAAYRQQIGLYQDALWRGGAR